MKKKTTEEELKRTIVGLQAKLFKLFGDTYRGAVQLEAVRQAIESGEEFSWSGNSRATKEFDSRIKELNTAVQENLRNSVNSGWSLGDASASNALYAVLGKTKSDRATLNAIGARGREDMRERGVNAHAWYNDPRDGLSISSRVWNITGTAKKEIEIIVQNGIKEGKTASEIAGSVQSYLIEPNRLYRRVRDKDTGELELSKAAKQYHPGMGVYRSSYMNAMRLARTEVNAAYRRAEWESYQQNPLITGYRIELSNNHTTLRKGEIVPLRDICDRMVGNYPKTFRWTGWHPQCRCRMVPIIISKDDFRARIRALKDGKLDAWKPASTTTEPPEGFTKWIEDNRERILNARTKPWWIRDNFINGDVSKGLATSIANLQQIVAKQLEINFGATDEQREAQSAKPYTGYDARIEDLRNWEKSLGLQDNIREITAKRSEGKAHKKELEHLVVEAENKRNALQLRWQKELVAYLDEIGTIFTTHIELYNKYLQVAANTRPDPSRNYTDSVTEMRAKIIDFRKELAEVRANVKKVPEEISNGSYMKGKYKFDERFFDLIDPDHPIKMLITSAKNHSGAGSCCHWDMELDDNGHSFGNRGECWVEVDKNDLDGRYGNSSYGRATLIYHEFGHGIDYQRKIYESEELKTMLAKMNEKWMKRETANDWVHKYLEPGEEVRKAKKEGMLVRENWCGKYVDVRLEGSRVRIERLMSRISEVGMRIEMMDESILLKHGVSKRDAREAFLNLEDAILTISKGEYGSGHEKTYMQDEGYRNTEFVAHSFENAFLGNPVFKHFMPEEYQEMIDLVNSLK